MLHADADIQIMFLIVKFSYQPLLWHDYFIVKFFVQSQYRDDEKLSQVAPLSKVAPVDGTIKHV